MKSRLYSSVSLERRNLIKAMNTNQVEYEILFVFDKNWRICSAHNTITKINYYCIFCPCDYLRTYMFPGRETNLFNHCELHSTIPDVVMTTLRMIK